MRNGRDFLVLQLSAILLCCSDVLSLSIQILAIRFRSRVTNIILDALYGPCKQSIQANQEKVNKNRP